MVDAWTDVSSGWIWAGVTAVAVVIFLFTIFGRGAEQAPKQARKRTGFDMPIREAVNHLVSTVPHSFDSADKAECHFFSELYKLMCEGRLPVIGARDEGTPPRRLSRRECRRHKPKVTRVAPNPTCPDGVRFDLLDRKLEPLTLVEWKSFPGFTGLRVRSSNLLGMYPQNKTSGIGE